jgi:hypothetical protein
VRPIPNEDQENVAVPDLFRVYSARELMTMDRSFNWLIRGLLVEPTYGQIAGELKSLKSYIAGFVQVSLSAGLPVFDCFKVDKARTVLAYIGEGGRIPYTRRLERIATAMGASFDELPLHLSFDVAPIQSFVFSESLRRDLELYEPGLVHVDPLYAFHGTSTKASDLHQEGSLLSLISAPCMAAGASSQIVNHFNQTGSGSDLKRITQAGSGEWADSWMLLSHRERPDVDNGVFQLLLEVGSRQWGGTSWDLDINLGRFDAESGEYDGAITWDIERHSGQSSAGDDEGRVLKVLEQRPLELTKEELVKLAGGQLKRMRNVVTNLEEKGLVTVARSLRPRSDGRPMPVWVYELPSRVGTLEDEG